MITFEPLSVSQTFGRVLHVYWTQKVLFWKIAAAITLPSVAILAALQAVMEHLLSDLNKDGQEEDPVTAITDAIAELVKHLPVVFCLTLVYLLLNTLLGVAGAGAMIHATAQIHLNDDRQRQDIQWTDSFRKGLRRFGSLFCAGFLVVGIASVVCVGLPLVLMNVKALAWLGMLLLAAAPFLVLYLLVRFMTVYPVIIVENVSAMEGLRRSWDLSSGSFCYFFCSVLFFSVLQTVLFGILNSVLVGSNALKPVGIVLGTVSHGIPTFLFMPCFAILRTVLYLSRRIEMEGLTKQALTRELFDDDDRTTPLLLGEHGGDDDADDDGDDAETEDV